MFLMFLLAHVPVLWPVPNSLDGWTFREQVGVPPASFKRCCPDEDSDDQLIAMLPRAEEVEEVLMFVFLVVLWFCGFGQVVI